MCSIKFGSVWLKNLGTQIVVIACIRWWCRGYMFRGFRAVVVKGEQGRRNLKAKRERRENECGGVCGVCGCCVCVSSSDVCVSYVVFE